jgi:membrane associated rhomboid family serine protease
MYYTKGLFSTFLDLFRTTPRPGRERTKRPVFQCFPHFPRLPNHPRHHFADTQVLPAWLTLFSYMFLHGGVVHLLTNMTCLWVFGILAEPVMGTKRFALTYLAFGVITGMVLVAIIPHWTKPMVGASGSISGVLGAFLALHFSERIRQRRRTIVVLLLEGMPLLAVVAWFVTRNMPSDPDRAAAAWHLIPFLLAWYGVRVWKGLGSLCRAKRRT